MPRRTLERVTKRGSKDLLGRDVRSYLERVIEILGDSLIEISIFGSTARGEARRGSDIDVLVIVRGGRRDASNALTRVCDLLSDEWWGFVRKGVLIDLVVVGDEEWEWMKKIGLPFALNVEEEKVVLYRKSS